MNFNFSIIIPHKNIPQLLQRCLDSIPVRDDIQVIVVDDNSDADKVDFDNFPQWSGKNYEFYFTKEGKGAGYARNVGLSKAKGKWVTFVDADDFLYSNSENIFDTVLRQDADVVYCNAKAVKNEDITQPSNRYFYGWYFEKYAVDKDETLMRYRFHSPVGKFIKSDLIHDYHICFHETRYSNDVYFSACIGCYAQKIHVINDIFYVVTERQGSLASSQFSDIIISPEECYDRTNEAINVRILFSQLNVKEKDNQLYEYSKKLRKFHKKEYVLYVIRLYFKHPKYAALLTKEDLKLLRKKIIK